MWLKYHPYIQASTREEEMMERRLRCVAESLRSEGWFTYESQRHGELTGVEILSTQLRHDFSSLYANHGPATSGDDTKLRGLVEARTNTRMDWKAIHAQLLERTSVAEEEFLHSSELTKGNTASLLPDGVSTSTCRGIPPWLGAQIPHAIEASILGRNNGSSAFRSP
jgi:hypothetical protein